MLAVFKNRGYKFYADAIIALLTVIAVIFFALSYTTGYIGIVYGKENSIVMTVFLALILLISVGSVVVEILGIRKSSAVVDVAVLLNTALIMVVLVLLIADRVDALGNCIIAPWDAGHGGEDSVYLSFVTMGCLLVSIVLNIVGTFIVRHRR